MAFNLNNNDNSENSDLAEINIVPLVDVMLVLLIIFMVAAPLSISGIQVKLPTSKSKGEAISSEKLILSINESGDYYIEKNKISPNNLTRYLKDLFAQKKSNHLYIRADRNVPYGTVVDAMGLAKLAGAEKLGMLTRPIVLGKEPNPISTAPM